MTDGFKSGPHLLELIIVEIAFGFSKSECGTSRVHCRLHVEEREMVVVEQVYDFLSSSEVAAVRVKSHE